MLGRKEDDKGNGVAKDETDSKLWGTAKDREPAILQSMRATESDTT